MKKINIGESLKVSTVGLGAINFGTKIKQKTAFSLMDAYHELQGNFIDTANNYAVWNGGDGGESEKTIGAWMRQRNVRDEIIIATKVGARPRSLSQRDFSDMEGLGRKTILSSVQRSLENLQTHYIDLLYLHVDDFSTPQQEVMETLHELIEDGIIREIGCSNFYTWRIERARQICERNKYHFFHAVQQRYSYPTPVIDADFYPQIALNKELSEYLKYDKALTLVAYSPLLNGQYNHKEILKKEYQTAMNEERLTFLHRQDTDPNIWVMNYILHSVERSAALLTTSSITHLKEIASAIK